MRDYKRRDMIRMVENFSKIMGRLSTILFFCKKRGKTFDCFSHDHRVSIESSKGTQNKRP